MNGVLPHQEILKLIPAAIVNGDIACVRTASYDMRIGDEYYLHDESCANGKEIRSRSQGVIVIPPNGLLMCTMHETLKLPPDIVGHLSLKVALLMKGVMMASQSQIDAGYEGQIFGMLYNLSNRDVCLRDGEFVLKLELVRLEQPTSKPYDNSVSRTASLNRYIDKPLISSLVSIREDAKSAVKEVKEAKDKINLTQVVGTVIGGLTAVFLGIVGVMAQAHFASEPKVEQLSQKVTTLETQAKVSEAATSWNSRLEELEQQNKALRARLDMVEAKSLESSKNPAVTPKVDRGRPQTDKGRRQKAAPEGVRP